MKNYCQLWLTCKDKAEADTIAQALLNKRLIVCARQLPIGSDFLWKGAVDHNNEILLIMDSREDLFEEIEDEVKKLHSYETFVLQATQLRKVSDRASVWMRANLK